MSVSYEKLKALAVRRASAPVPIENTSLAAGSPMYYYCAVCGQVADKLPEDHIQRPRKLCDYCEALLEPAPAAAGCVFYGQSVYFPFSDGKWSPTKGAPFLLFSSGGNQCALISSIASSHSPCQMEIDGLAVDWRTCPRIKQCHGTMHIEEPLL